MRGVYLVGTPQSWSHCSSCSRCAHRARSCGRHRRRCGTGRRAPGSRQPHRAQCGALTYNDPIAYYQQTAYQKVVLTQYQTTLRLYLTASSSFQLDEARYFETRPPVP